MNDKENGDDSLKPQQIPSTGPKQEIAEAGPEDTSPSVPMAIEKPDAAEAIKQQVDADGSRPLSVDQELRTGEAASSVAAKQEIAELPEAGPERPPVPVAGQMPETVRAMAQQADADGSPSSSVGHEPRTDESASSVVVRPVSVKKPHSFFAEQPLPPIEMAPRVLRYQSRRDFLVFGAGALEALAGGGFLLPEDTLTRMGLHRNLDS